MFDARKQIEIGENLKAQAIDRVELSQGEWVQKAIKAIRWLCKHKQEFTTDHVWKVLQKVNVPEPKEPRAMGAAMRRAQSMGLIFATDKTTKSVRSDCHRRPLTVWRVKA